jgi:membrane-bound inhibitor of C-type lysozyme
MKKLLFVAILLSACCGKNQETSKVEKHVCGNRTALLEFAADFESVKMSFGKKTYDMKRQVSASGMRFATSDNKAEYFSKGDESIVSVDGVDMECYKK